MTVAGRVESKFTVPAGQSLAATNTGGGGGGPTAIPVTAGSYFATDFVAMIQAQLNALRLPATWTVTLSTTTGLVSINWTGAGGTTYTIDFTGATATRDVLGYTGNLTTIGQGVASVATRQHRFLWIPNSALNADSDIRQTPDENDQRETESPTGDVVSLSGSSKYVHTSLAWEGVSIERMWISDELVANQSYQRFYLDALRGTGHAWNASPCSELRIYDSRGAMGSSGSPAVITNWKSVNVPSLVEVRMAEDKWIGLWRVEWPRIVGVT